ncbi:hypothetical protein HF086_002902 [Spodoptera exigua]|uniref:Uncharacterized protein n=1 Tax=Spodoptera exigua TaxID=7107 RepID=A0A922SC06_SPOEX|nr:hypothetical protein HF086_002902 [Spodoptera exigua]
MARSPNLNPIENLWGLIVQKWDNRAERTKEALVTHCEQYSTQRLQCADGEVVIDINDNCDDNGDSIMMPNDVFINTIRGLNIQHKLKTITTTTKFIP